MRQLLLGCRIGEAVLHDLTVVQQVAARIADPDPGEHHRLGHLTPTVVEEDGRAGASADHTTRILMLSSSQQIQLVWPLRGDKDLGTSHGGSCGQSLPP